VSFEAEGIEARDAAAKLLEQGFVLRFIPDPYPYVRASVHLFNTEEEIEKFSGLVARL
jgi:selenocysteine lyase/cysteine desulfurase